ncbi:MAG: hypothetical protein ACOY32_09620 [Thermodesulfobacteriota bacterium]
MTRTKKSSKSTVLFFIFLILLALLALFFYFKTGRHSDTGPAISLEQVQQKLDDKVADLEKKSPLTDEAPPPAASMTPPAEESDAVDAGAAGESPAIAPPTDPCRAAADRIDQFFTHLDEQQYVTDLQLDADAKAYFNQIITKLLANPPKIVRETDNLLSILQNAAHFFRVLGPKNMFNLKKIMAHEKAAQETVLADFYTLIDPQQDCRRIGYAISSPLPELYTYSVYFLNTLGGQAYLARREIALRTLAKYYCILVLDQANDTGVNHLGFDIRYPITSLLDEMRVVTDLRNREQYLEKLRILKEKYEKKQGKL